MNPRDLFEMLVKLLGLWLIVAGIQHLAWSLYISLMAGFSASSVGDSLIQATPQFLIGLFLFAGAGSIVRLAYPSGAAAASS